MDIKQAVRTTLDQSNFIVQGYLADLTEKDLLARACNGANHIAWQLGHVIASEAWLSDKVKPGALAALPAGFAEKHKKDSAGSSDASAFLTKEQYLSLLTKVRAETLKVLDSLTPADFDKPITGVPPFIKTVGELMLFLGTHWVMHAGQWAITRRSLGKPPLF